MKFGVQTIKIYNMINFTRGLNPLDAMGIGEKIIKIKDWIINHKIPNQEDIDGKRVQKNGEEKVFKLTLPPNNEWKYGNIEIIFHISEPQE